MDTDGHWVISVEDRAKHNAQFEQLKPVNGFVGGKLAFCNVVLLFLVEYLCQNQIVQIGPGYTLSCCQCVMIH